MHESFIYPDEKYTSINSEPVFAIDSVGSVSQTPYFQTTARKKLLDQLHNFTEDQNSIAVLIGEIASGKSTLLKFFSTQCLIESQYVQGSAKFDVQTMFSAQVLEDLTVSCLYIIDDAHSLTPNNLQMLISIFGNQTNTKAKLLLVGETILQARVKSLLEKNNLEFPLATFACEPLTQQETKSYLKQFFSHRLSRRKQFLSKQNVEQIYSLSKGYIGRINRVAGQFMIEQSNRKSPISTIDVLLTLAILCLLTVVASRVWSLFSQKETTLRAPLVKTAQSVPCQVDSASFIASIEHQPEELLMVAEEGTLLLPEPVLPAFLKKS